MSTLVLEAKFRKVTRGDIVAITFFSFIAALLFVAFGNFYVALLYFTPALTFMLISFLRRFMTARVYSDRVEFESRVLVKNNRRIEASKIESVNTTDSLLGRSRYGSVVVRGSGLGSIRISPIEDQAGFADAVRSISDAAKTKATSAPSVETRSDSSLSEQLLQLTKLRESGALTDEQFESAKAKLLS